MYKLSDMWDLKKDRKIPTFIENDDICGYQRRVGVRTQAEGSQRYKLPVAGEVSARDVINAHQRDYG